MLARKAFTISWRAQVFALQKAVASLTTRMVRLLFLERLAMFEGTEQGRKPDITVVVVLAER
jgi:hypothetical protein